VHLPELSLLRGSERCLMRKRSSRVHAKRKMFEPHNCFDTVNTLGLQFSECSGKRGAERTLEIGEQDNLDMIVSSR
jgi:hypothetical protein